MTREEAIQAGHLAEAAESARQRWSAVHGCGNVHLWMSSTNDVYLPKELRERVVDLLYKDWQAKNAELLAYYPERKADAL